MSNYHKYIAAVVYALRKRSGLTQDDMAAVLKVERSVYSRKETGKVSISATILKVIADTHKVSVASIHNLADTVSHIDFKTMSLVQMVNLFVSRSPSEEENFSTEELFTIFSLIKDYF